MFGKSKYVKAFCNTATFIIRLQALSNIHKLIEKNHGQDLIKNVRHYEKPMTKLIKKN